MKHSLRYLYLIIIAAIWFLLVGILVKRNYFDSSALNFYASLDTGIKQIPTDSEWMTIYHNGKKIGYSMFFINNLNGKGYNINSIANMQVAIAGMQATIIIHNNAKIDSLST